MNILIIFLSSLLLHIPEIRGYKFENYYIVFIAPSYPPYRVDSKKGIARWEKDKGYVWIQESLFPLENFIVDKKGERIMFIGDITNCKEIHGWRLKIFNINTFDTLIYCIETEIENPEVFEQGTVIFYKDYHPVFRNYRLRNDTIFFYIKQENKFLKHKEFKIYKNGEYFKSINKKFIFFNINNMEFGGIDKINENFRWKNDVDISITVGDSLNFWGKLFVFDKVMKVFNKEKLSLSLTKFNSNSKMDSFDALKDSSIAYYMEFRKSEVLKDRNMFLYYIMAIYNDSLYCPVKKYYDYIKNQPEKFLNLIEKFKKLGNIDTFSKPSIAFDLKEERIITGVHFTLIKDKFHVNICLSDTSEYDGFYRNAKSLIDKSYRLLDLCMKNKRFREEVVRANKYVGGSGTDYYLVNLSRKEGRFPPYLKNGEPVIPILIGRRPPLSSRKKFMQLSEKERKNYLKKRIRAKKFIVYHLDERERLVRWERK